MVNLKKRLPFVGIVMALALVVMLISAGTAAATPPLPLTANVNNVTAGGGTVSIKPNPRNIVVRTTGEVTNGTLGCTNLACSRAGLDGASLQTIHNSTVRLTPTGPGVFSVAGNLSGTLNLAGVIQGPFNASISGSASCVPVGTNPCGTFFINVADAGNWNAPSSQAHGTLSVNISGVIGVGLVGSGTLTGSIHSAP